MFALVLLSILVGAFAQRITGMGFALVASPALVLLLGPFDGVLIVNVCAAISAAIVFARIWRNVDWRRYRYLVIPALIAIVPGSWLAANLPTAVLEISIGILLLTGLVISLIATRTTYVAHGRSPIIVAGAASGAMNTIAGIGGPAVSIYAVLARWKQSSFAATMQPYFLTIATASLVTKLAISGGRVPEFEWWQWALMIGALLVGLVIAELVGDRIPEHGARNGVLVIAFLGSISALVHGLIDAGVI